MKSLKPILLFISMLFCLSPCFAQKEITKAQDSILNWALDDKKSDIWIARRLITAGDELHSTLTDTSIWLLHKAINIFRVDSPNHPRRPVAYGILGTAYYHKERLNASIQYLDSGINLISAKGDSASKLDLTIAMVSYINLSNAYHKLHLQDKCLENLYKADSLAEMTGDLTNKAFVYSNLGEHFRRNEEIEKAIIYFNKALEIRKKFDNPSGLAVVHNNLALAHLHQKNFHLALQHLRPALKIFKESQYPLGISSSLVNIGVILDSLQKRDSSLLYLQEGEKQARLYQINSVLSASLNGQASQLYRDGKYEASIAKSLEAANLKIESEDFERKRDVYNTLYLNYKAMGKFKEALRYLEHNAQYQDSLITSRNENKTLEMEARFETSQQEKELDRLKIQSLEDEKEAHKNEQITFGLALVLMILSLATFTVSYISRQRKKWNQILNNKNNALNHTNNLLTENQVIITNLYKQIALILNEINEGILYIDSEQNVLHINKFMQQLLGYKPDEQENNLENVLNKLRLKNQPQLEQLFNGLKKGTVTENQIETEIDNTYYEWLFKSVIEGDGNKGYLVVAIDVTEKKNYVNHLMKMMEIKDKFNAIVAHDLRAPFNNISQLSKLLEHAKSDQHEIIKHIDTSIHNANEIIETLLESSLSEKENLKQTQEKIELSNLLNSCIKRFELEAQEKQITIHSPDLEANCFYLARSVNFQRAIDNILSNAMKFTPSGKNIYVSLAKNTENIIISIEDEGIGIPENSLKVIFDKTEIINRKGLRGEKSFGLGIPVIKELIENEGGVVRIYSAENKGTTVEITLPRKN